jgi:hypothetical protein
MLLQLTKAILVVEDTWKVQTVLRTGESGQSRHLLLLAERDQNEKYTLKHEMRIYAVGLLFGLTSSKTIGTQSSSVLVCSFYGK